MPNNNSPPKDRRIHDWAKDSKLENGNYGCLCSSCGACFVGHKRRGICRVCATAKNNPRMATDEVVMREHFEQVMVDDRADTDFTRHEHFPDDPMIYQNEETQAGWFGFEEGVAYALSVIASKAVGGEAEARGQFNYVITEWGAACLLKRPLEECSLLLDKAYTIAQKAALSSLPPQSILKSRKSIYHCEEHHCVHMADSDCKGSIKPQSSESADDFAEEVMNAAQAQHLFRRGETINQYKALERLKMAALPQSAPVEGQKVRLWDTKHSAWWRAGGSGYTDDDRQAGLFPLDEVAARNAKLSDRRLVPYPALPPKHAAPEALTPHVEG